MPTAVTLRSGAQARTGLLLVLGFRLVHALHLLAGALGDVLPLARVVVDLVLTRAGVRARQVRAVVLPRLGDAVALFLFLPLRGGLARQAERQHRSESRRDDQTLVHGCAPWVVGVILACHRLRCR